MKPSYHLQNYPFAVTGDDQNRGELTGAQERGQSLEGLLSTTGPQNLGGQVLVMIGQGEEILRLLSNYASFTFASSGGNVGMLVSKVNGAVAAAAATATVGQVVGGLRSGVSVGSADYADAVSDFNYAGGASRSRMILDSTRYFMHRKREFAGALARNYLVVQLVERGAHAGFGIDTGGTSVRAGQLAGLLGPHL